MTWWAALPHEVSAYIYIYIYIDLDCAMQDWSICTMVVNYLFLQVCENYKHFVVLTSQGVSLRCLSPHQNICNPQNRDKFWKKNSQVLRNQELMYQNFILQYWQTMIKTFQSCLYLFRLAQSMCFYVKLELSYCRIYCVNLSGLIDREL